MDGTYFFPEFLTVESLMRTKGCHEKYEASDRNHTKETGTRSVAVMFASRETSQLPKSVASSS